MNYFNKKVVLITGGASGLGAALAEALHQSGALVTTIDIREVGLETSVPEPINRKTGSVTDFLFIREVAEELIARHGRIDILVNNAGVNVTGEARDLDITHWKTCIDVNLFGVVNTISVIYPLMARQGHGQIVNISSMAGLAPLPLVVPYVASKYAVTGLSKSLRLEAGSLGIKVNLVCPGRLDTSLFDNSQIVNVSRQRFLSEVPFKPYPLNMAVKRIINGMIKNKPVIIFPLYVKWMWYIHMYAGIILHPFYHYSLKKFRRMRQSNLQD